MSKEQTEIDENMVEKKYNQNNYDDAVMNRKNHYQRLLDIKYFIEHETCPDSYANKPRHIRSNLRRDAKKYKVHDDTLYFVQSKGDAVDVVGRSGVCQSLSPLEWVEGVHFDRVAVCCTI